MGFEIPIDVDYFDHPKTRQLMTIAGSEADVFPLRLWKWASSYCKSGDLGPDPLYIEQIVGWIGKGRNRTRLILALIRVGFVDLLTPENTLLKRTEAERKTQESALWGGSGVSPGTYVIHDWMEHVGRAVRIYEQKKQKQRDEYARKHGILPEEKRQNSAYPGDPVNPGNPGGDTASPPPPPLSASPGTPEGPDATGQKAETGDATWTKIVEAYRRWDPTVPVRKCESEIVRATKLGISLSRLLGDVERLAQTMKLWTIVDNYEHPAVRPNNGNGTGYHKTRENQPTERAPVLAERREDVQRRQDEARARADQMLADMDPDELDGWKADAEAAGEKARIPKGAMRDAFVKTELRRRAAEAFQIEGV